MKASITNNVGKFAKKAYSAADKTIFQAVMKAGGLVKKEAQQGARSRKIANAYKVVGRNPKNTGPEAHIGIQRGAKGWYGKFFETGTKDHDIKPKKGKMLAFATLEGIGEFANSKGKVKRLNYYRFKGGYTLNANEARVYAFKVHHPGMEAEPNLQPALIRKQTEISKVIGEAAVKINQEASR
ncbi:hypothetical protein M7775_19135 [Sporomusa sphaeroides DSM 2875]|uniref:hypothetical protein n=1 Tax=Sporomusa sphaeroides TaxID=47679 RepID=UPI00202E1E6E|nr:hypothetical protein [Sporomusa sphaeroides]MCM0760668.1 hypothetical protein [Sporomusa sphaeroides DSM 2875]